MHRHRIKKKNNSWKRILLVTTGILIGLLINLRSAYNAPLIFNPNTIIVINKGDTLAKFYDSQSDFSKLMIKIWLKNNNIGELVAKNLKEGSYALSGSYSKSELMNLIQKGPNQIDYLRLTLLEGRSIYDIDQHLTNQGLISQGDYIHATHNQNKIWLIKSEFPFLAMLPAGKSLEGFLYPDTYFLDKNATITDQLIKAQLKNFNEKVRKNYRESFITFQPENLGLQNYNALILASVIENEEKANANKPIIAGIFINRLKNGMRLDADVTLCYGLQITYDQCRAAIVPNLYDSSNPYNTRQNIGLPPTPISSPSVQTLGALFQYTKTKALYYLHDSKGQIHYGATLEEHNLNKAKYL